MCRFWKDSGDGQCGTDGLSLQFGRCHRYPPTRTQDQDEGDTIGYTFPRVEASSWCGEYQPKPSSPTATYSTNIERDLITFPKVEVTPDKQGFRFDEVEAGSWIQLRIRGMKRAHKGAAGQGSLLNHYRKFLFSWLAFSGDPGAYWSPSVEDMKTLMNTAPEDQVIFRHLLAENRLSAPAAEFVRRVLTTPVPPAGQG